MFNARKTQFLKDLSGVASDFCSAKAPEYICACLHSSFYVVCRVLYEL